ncbi:hypothetical protein COX93_01100 [Candidatus Nomurabacteria bacterium CG_4_10_14_0_2_um_filter_30_12]|uniref:Uncharacterized protein n=3 Tax=Candidatus Nomuraibacteriota TaxID=1752729 RepID=A0A1J4V2C5_9BACT|nr:MAG: hypothetical protein AUJ22_00120 [Candidatus Nomurabacteria bacterium CG1_02_31_12]PIR68817.1 MAG: hypothetical protein COU48_01920 [Candidatus Nomurabacteria bacterium CG10_big_fil_rev_8_21_14_0_10_03_31_7]PIZ87431.1 MAG: hypothetical protein COX93_01100 [Candidatus Nomurabacteria bacterium CG_4_10_14_0_2_um_filter_30_12]
MEDSKLKNKNVETFAEDMVKAIENDRGGLIKKIIHEEEEHEAQKKNLSPESAKNKTFLLIGFLLLFLASILFIFLFFFNKEINTVSVAPLYSSIIFTDQTDFYAIDGFTEDKIVQTIFNRSNNTKVKIGGVNGIYLTENKMVVSFNKFMTFIKGSLNKDQSNLFSNNFLIGIFKSGASSVSPNIGDLFILLKIRSFTDIFPVMKVWENKMLYDFYGFFGVDLTPETNYLFTKDWEEGIVSNKNARILKDNDGKIILMYVYLDDNSIVITDSESAVNEVVLRLNSSKVKK